MVWGAGEKEMGAEQVKTSQNSVCAKQNVHALIPGFSEYVILYGKKDLANVIKITDLEVGKLS